MPSSDEVLSSSCLYERGPIHFPGGRIGVWSGSEVGLRALQLGRGGGWLSPLPGLGGREGLGLLPEPTSL